MANEAKLNLVITARDEAKQVIEELVNSLRSAFDGLQQDMSRMASGANFTGPLEEGLRALSTSVQETTRTVAEGFSQMAQSAQLSSEEMNSSMTNMGHSVSNLEQMIAAQMIGDQLKEIGDKGKEAFLGAVDSAAEFEFNVSRIGAVLTTVGKASTSQMQQMSDMALSLGSHSSFSANQIAEGMYTLARQGLDATTIMGDGVNGAINVVNDLAQATDSSMTDTATVITDVIHEFGVSGSELRNVANIMSGTLHNSSESLQDLYMSMRQVGPVAGNMHQSVEDVSTALALLAQHGITGSAAGTSLKNMLLGLEPHTKKAAALMKDLGISSKEGAADSFYQLNGNLKPMPEILDVLNQKFGGLNDKQKESALAATFTKYGLAGLNVVVGESRDKFLAFQKELKMDDAATIAAKKYDNLHGDLMKFQASLSTMGKSFGDTLGPALRTIVQDATKFVQWMTALPKPVKEAGMVALGLASALAIVAGSIITFGIAMSFMAPGFTFLGEVIASTGLRIVTFGGLFGKVAGIVRAFSFAPLIGGVTRLMGVLGTGAGRLLTFGGIFNIIRRPMILFVEGISNLHHIVPAAFNAIWNSVARASAFIVTSIPRMTAAFLRFSTLIYTSGPRILAAMIRAFSWSSIVSLVQGAAMAIRVAMTFMMGPWGILIAVVVGGVALLITHWSQIKDWVVQHFQGTVPHALQTMQTFFSTTWSQIKNAVQEAMNYVMPTIMSGISSVQAFWNHVWPEIYQVLDVTWKLCLAVLAPAIALIGTLIVAGLGFVKGAWSSGWATIGTVLKTAWDLISGVIRIAWSLISGIIEVGLDLLTGHWSQAWNSLKSTVSNVLNGIMSLLSNLGNDAFNFGKNFVSMMAKGITSAVGAVTSAVSSVASSIKSFLGFSSPTELGPAADSDTWGPNFVNMMAQGIKQHTPSIQAAVNGIALNMKTGVTSVNQTVQRNQITVPNTQNQKGTTNIYIQIDGRSAKTDRELTDMIANKFYKQMGIVSI